MIHLEFVVHGLPVSHQTNQRAKLRAWKEQVRQAAAKVWNKPPLTDKLRIVVVHFCESHKLLMDDDNMVKPVRDALNELVYIDDRQITDTATRQCDINDEYRVRGWPKVLLEAFAPGVPFVYVKVESAPDHAELLT